MPKILEPAPEVVRQVATVVADLRREIAHRSGTPQMLRNAGVGQRAAGMLINAEPGTCAGMSFGTFALACDAVGLELVVREKA